MYSATPVSVAEIISPSRLVRVKLPSILEFLSLLTKLVDIKFPSTGSINAVADCDGAFMLLSTTLVLNDNPALSSSIPVVKPEIAINGTNALGFSMAIFTFDTYITATTLELPLVSIISSTIQPVLP